MAVITVTAALAGGCRSDAATPTGTFVIDAPAVVVTDTTATSGTAGTAGAGDTVGTADIPVPLLPGGTADIPLPRPTDTGLVADAPVVITVTVGVDDAPDRVETVALGAVVTLIVTDPDADDEFHLHGYDLGDGDVISAGDSSTLVFTADQAGEFELESHETGNVLLLLSVR